MTRKMTKKKRDDLIADVFEGRRDLSGLAEAHRMSPDELAAWIGLEENRRCLAGLCLLADLQTQLMLSRYRQVAVTELIKQASGGNEASGACSAEQSRKACVDLLRADLKRADAPGMAPGASPGSEGEDAVTSATIRAEAASIRAALYGDESADPTPPDGTLRVTR